MHTAPWNEQGSKFRTLHFLAAPTQSLQNLWWAFEHTAVTLKQNHKENQRNLARTMLGRSTVQTSPDT